MSPPGHGPDKPPKLFMLIGVHVFAVNHNRQSYTDKICKKPVAAIGDFIDGAVIGTWTSMLQNVFYVCNTEKEYYRK